MRKECKKNEGIEKLKEEEKEEICIEVSQKVRDLTLIFSIFYILATIKFIMWINMFQWQNAFAKWYWDVFDSVYPLITGDWGGTWNQISATVLLICLKLSPILIINSLPLVLFIVIMTNIFFRRKIGSRI
ncbi:hypothetical protein HMPREF3206_00997 [Fusobacterium equinum]|uniref:Uncharacterized protein n=2 Tax=Fusobacteriaceae TaxID=203492 RepID=A0A133NDR6_9FUSO|nr:hypothetical protein HMPREF3206_00997 [Fusobacterium equinum]